MSNHYLKSRAATLLWAMKCAVGVISVYLLYMMGRDFFPAMKGLHEAGTSLMTAQDILWAEITKDLKFGSDVNIDTFGMAAVYIFSAANLYVLLYPVMAIIDAVAATYFRVTGKGIDIIRAMHFFAMLVWMVLFLTTLYAICQINIPDSVVQRLLPAAAGVLNIPLVLSVIIELLLCCYHKDIVHVLSAVKLDLAGEKTQIKKTHLSGIAVLMGLMSAMVCCVCFLALVNERSANSVIPAIAVIIAGCHAVRLFAAAVCSRQLKAYFNRRRFA